MPRCHICDTEYQPLVSFGPMPIANGFLTDDQFAGEYFFELAVGFCHQCLMVQLAEQPRREQMFNDRYPFFSGTSQGMTVHFREFAEQVRREFLNGPDPLAVEIGSNDGIMLDHFRQAGIRHLGVEPSANVAQVAIDRGIDTMVGFFDADCARRIVADKGQADAFLGANVMCHIPYLHSIIDGIELLCKPSGVVVFEDPYLGDIVQKTSYDQIYDEHVFLFSAHSVRNAFARHGWELIDVRHQETHGGSMRYVLSRRGSRPVAPAVAMQLGFERELGLHLPRTYRAFERECRRSRDQLKALLADLRRQGKRVVGYAATSKSTTVLNYGRIGPDLVEFIYDTTPIKQGKYSPGMHIPVRPYREFADRYPDYAVLFAYNHAREILSKEPAFVSAGGRWITFVPRVEILA
jgi:methylation protein EvaC